MPTFTDGTVVNAASLRVLVGSQPPTYRARQVGGAQTFTNSTGTDVTFDTSDTDSDSGRTSSTVYTCKTAGLWQIVAWINWTGNSSGERHLYVMVNGTTVRDIGQAGASTVNLTQSLVVEQTLAVNDTVKIQALQNSGGSLANVSLVPGYAGVYMVRISN